MSSLWLIFYIKFKLSKIQCNKKERKLKRLTIGKVNEKHYKYTFCLQDSTRSVETDSTTLWKVWTSIFNFSKKKM